MLYYFWYVHLFRKNDISIVGDNVQTCNNQIILIEYSFNYINNIMQYKFTDDK